MDGTELPQREENLVTEEVAQLLRTSPSTIRYWRHKGYGPKGVRVGRRVLYPLSEVQRWLEERSREQG
jgi:excisionase family DNA binding protein